MAGLDKYTKLLLHMDGSDQSTSFIDECGKKITPYSSAKIVTSKSKFGGSCTYLDGTGGYISIPDSSDWYFTGDFCIEGWFYLTDVSGTGNNQTLFSQYADANNYNDLTFYQSNLYWTCNIGGVRKADIRATGVLTGLSNQWVHIELDKSNGVYYYFINGISQTVSIVIADVGIPDISAPLWIGHNGYGNALNGYIDEYRISKGIARHTSNFVPAKLSYDNTAADPWMDPRLSLLMHMNGNEGSTAFIEETNKPLTVLGNSKITYFNKIGTGCAFFDGTGWIDTPDHIDFNNGTGDFTIETYFKRTVVSSRTFICAQCDNGGNTVSNWIEVRADIYSANTRA